MKAMLDVRRNQQFDETGERAYYVRPPSGYRASTPGFVDSFMRLSTGRKDWPAILDGREVLELGAGSCTLLAGLLDRAQPKRYVASDLFEDRLAVAREALDDRCLEFRELNALDTGFPDGSFDVILSFGLFHHIPELGRAFAECRRILRPGGKLIFRDPWGGNPALWLMYRFVLHNSPNESPLRLRRTRSLLCAHGFRVDHVSRFWLRFPWAPTGPWSTNVAMMATRPMEEGRCDDA